MVIRKEQREALRRGMLAAFEDEMVAHLAAFSPPLYKALKEPPLRAAIRFGMARAATHGITLRGPVRSYLELMLLFGSHFDTDPQYPWAGAVLGNPDPALPQMKRAQRLFDKTRDYRRKVAGPGDRHTLAALRALSKLAREPLHLSSSPRKLALQLLGQLSEAYPQKAAYLGARALTAIIDRGRDVARDLGCTTPRALATPVILMFAFGHGCFDDPLYPWIGGAARDPEAPDGEARMKRLERRAINWLDQVIATFTPPEAAA